MKKRLLIAVLTILASTPVLAAGDAVEQVAGYKTWRLMNPEPIVARSATFLINEPEFKPDLSAAGG